MGEGVAKNVNIKDLLKQIVLNDEEIYSKVAKVTKVNDNNTIDAQPLDGSPDLFNVRLQAGNTEKGLLIVPAVDSFCVVSFLSESTCFASQFSEIQSIYLNGDSFGGLIKIEELKTQLNIISQRIDIINQAIKTAVVAPGDGGATFKANLISVIDSQIQKEDFTKIENEQVKHG